jgi:hypothetical protein
MVLKDLITKILRYDWSDCSNSSIIYINIYIFWINYNNLSYHQIDHIFTTVYLPE